MRIRVLVLSCLVLAGCGSPPTAEAPAPVSPELTQGEHVWTTVDGNRMPYSVAGSGDVTVVLIHCWMCDRTFWDAQIPTLGQQYRTIAMDLPGHGQASADRAAWTVSGYGDDVAAFLNGLDLHDVVLVGHSMGGPVALRAAAGARGRVLGIVAVDSLHDAEFEFSGPQIEGFLQAFESDFVGTCNGFIDQMFPETDVEAVEAHVRKVGCDPSRAEAGIALMRSFGDIDMERWFSEAGVPIRAINAVGPNPTRVESNRKYADFEASYVDDVGHYLQMTRPERFNPVLLSAISGLAGPG